MATTLHTCCCTGEPPCSYEFAACGPYPWIYVECGTLPVEPSPGEVWHFGAQDPSCSPDCCYVFVAVRAVLPQFAGGGTLHGGTCIECLNPPDPDCWQEALQCIGCPDAGAPRLFIECTGVPDDTGETIFVYDGRCYIIQHEAAEVTTLPAGAVELPTIPVDTYVSCLACCEAIDVDCSDCSTPPCLDDPFTVITNGWTATDPDCNCTWTPVAVDIHPSDSTACSMSATEDAGGTPLSQGYTICCPPPPTCDPVDETNLDSISLSCATDGGAGPYWTMTLRYFVTEVGGGGAPLDWVYRKADIDQCPTGTYSVLIEQPDEFQICSPFTSDSAPSLGFTGP